MLNRSGAKLMLSDGHEQGRPPAPSLSRSVTPALHFLFSHSLPKQPSIEAVKPSVPTLSPPVPLLGWMYVCESVLAFEGACVWSPLIGLCSRSWSINEQRLSQPCYSLHICDPSLWAMDQHGWMSSLLLFPVPTDFTLLTVGRKKKSAEASNSDFQWPLRPSSHKCRLQLQCLTKVLIPLFSILLPGLYL